MVSEYARYMRGGYQVKDLMKLRPRDFMFWYRIHERSIIEESIIAEYVRKDKPVPSAKRLESMVDKKIKEIKESV
jgi:hypothetical protein